MNNSNIRLKEFLAFNSDLSLMDLCISLESVLQIPRFILNEETDNEWANPQDKYVYLHLTRPYQEGKLQQWSFAPEGCNFGLMLTVSVDAPAFVDKLYSEKHLVPRYAQAIANIVKSDVFYYNSWGNRSSNNNKSPFSPILYKAQLKG